MIVGAAIGGLAFLLAASLAAFCFISRRKKRQYSNNIELNNSESAESNARPDTNYQALSLTVAPETAHRLSALRTDKNYHIPYSEMSLEKEVGRGAFGVVWKGKWRSNSGLNL